MLCKRSAIGFAIYEAPCFQVTQEKYEKQALASASVPSVGQARLAHRALGKLNAAGQDCGTSVEPGEGRSAGLDIQMMLSGGVRILAGPGRIGRISIGR